MLSLNILIDFTLRKKFVLSLSEDKKQTETRKATFLIIMKKLLLTNTFCLQNKLFVIINLVDRERYVVFKFNL